MAMYRIKQDPDAPQPETSPYPPDEYWRQVQPGQELDLDLDEIAQINQAAVEDEADNELTPIRPFRSRLLMGFLAGFVVLAFVVWTAYTMFPQYFDFGTLIRSAQLSRDAALSSLQQAVVVIESNNGNGSGFNIRSEGLIVTNAHVVDGGGILTVTFNQKAGGQIFTARDPILVPGVDLALIPLEGSDLPAVKLATEPVQEGEDVIFIGNPLGYDWTISEGHIMANVNVDGKQAIYFQGPVHPGSSGSPLFNDRSEVVGVVFAMVGEEDAEQGLAVPISYLISQIEEEGL